ncbi:MFS transporter [Carboxylicivirga mesophila]|uniref:MFS transporter n=1 Tax=Carboxylicivirga mesophila TaxID=1166478 RepID=A0ABS5KFK5_9BACT|nr:MFS transporter [Carboxylicivirga mesophila]MBS2213840.1 MFS transporter [Carboxylicivirga mesophila]
MHKPGKFQLGKVSLIAVAHFFHDIYTAFLAPLLPLLRDTMGISLTFAGFLSVVQRLPTLLNPLVGVLAERTKARYFVIFTPAITAIAMSLVPVAPDKLTLVVLVLISGISSSFFHVPSPVMMRKVSGDRIGMGMSFYMVGGELARSAGPVAVLGAVELWGMQGVTYFIPTGILASTLLYFRLRNISIAENVNSGNGLAYLKTFKSFFPLIVSIALILFFRAAMKSALTFYLPVFLKSRGESLWFAGIALSILQGAGVIGTFFAGTISDKIGRRNMLLIATIGAPVLFFTFLYTTGWLQILALIATGLFLFATGPVFLAIVNEYKTEHNSFVNAVFMTTTFLIGAVMVLLVGLMGDYLSLELTYKIVGAFAFLSVPVVLFLPKK